MSVGVLGRQIKFSTGLIAHQTHLQLLGTGKWPPARLRLASAAKRQPYLRSQTTITGERERERERERGEGERERERGRDREREIERDPPPPSPPRRRSLRGVECNEISTYLSPHHSQWKATRPVTAWTDTCSHIMTS